MAPPPAAELLRWSQHDGFEPPLPIVWLRWRSDEGRLWDLPDGVTLHGPPPRQFGLRVLRQNGDSYSVRLVWDRTALAWEVLTRAQLLRSCLPELLARMGTDLWHLLDQPGGSGQLPRGKAA